MTSKKILLVSNDIAWQRRVRALMEARGQGIKLVGTPGTLKEATALLADRSVDLALIGKSFTDRAEFEHLLAELASRGVRWLSISDAGSNQLRRPLTGRQSGLFSLATDVPDEVLFGQIQSMLFGQRDAHQLANRRVPDPQKQGQMAKDHRSIILVGASTGGVEALPALCQHFGPDCPPTLIVQHTGQGYGDGIVRLLDRVSEARVVHAQDRMRLERGLICVAAGQRRHLVLAPRRPYTARLIEGEEVSGHMPSVDMLFESAVGFGTNVIAFLMTGMGHDGAKGLLQLRKAKASTFSQDEKSSVVYGMPRAAWDCGASMAQLRLNEAAGVLLDRAKLSDEIALRTSC